MRSADGLLTLGRWTTDRATIDGARTAIVDRGVRTTYRQLDDRATALAHRLEAAGYGRPRTDPRAVLDRLRAGA